MDFEEVSAFEEESQSSLLKLSETDRERLAETLQELLAIGSINGLESNKAGLYHWVRQHDEWVKELAALNGLEVAVYHEERLVQALPRVGSLRMRLPQDATIVWLALWYAGDVRWRDEGADQAFLSIAELVDLLRDQLLPDVEAKIPKGRLRDILRQAARLNLIRLTHDENFEEAGIEVLPAIRRVIPFRELLEWQEMVGLYQPKSNEDEEREMSLSEEQEEEV